MGALLTSERVETATGGGARGGMSSGYSRLMGANEEGTLARLMTRKSLVDPATASHRGRIVKTTGDGMLVEFASAVDAACCAVEVQRGIATQNISVPLETGVELFRIGIHIGGGYGARSLFLQDPIQMQRLGQKERYRETPAI